MFIIIPLALGVLLEFALEPAFKIRKKLFIRMGTVAAGSLAIIVPFAIWLVLSELIPIEDERIYTFSCIMITVFFIYGGGKNYAKA
jgi:hypothetical protein